MENKNPIQQMEDAFEQVEDGKHALFAMDLEEGDVRIQFDPENDDEVENARKSFKRLKAKGFAMFRMKRKGGAGSELKEFSRHAERIIAIPPIQGG